MTDMTAIAPARIRLARISPGRVLGFVILALGAWVVVFPYIWMISSSLKPTDEVYDADFTIWPRTFAGVQNYWDVLVGQPYPTFLLNSLIVCGGILAAQLVTAIPAAYALAKLRFRGQTILLGTVVACLTIPINVTSIPLYLGVVKAGLLDTYLSMMLPFLVSVFAIFLFRQFFRAYPDSIIQAARVDGFSEIEIVLRLIVPAAVPAVAAFSVFSFVAHWNDLYWPLIVVQSQEKMTASLSMMQYRSEFDINYGRTFAAATVVTIPMLIVFLFARRAFIRGITMSGVKG
ncbi:carbohydrate ABC transporter permease [Pseudooceanicola nanhaiensis]|jgi:multiple sugar transport system permease protein|uniref:Sn-glycerol-3-phosphate transport system permease protein UgpE n=1 Tax=Pseudooceanicola nanhaiensis TaxID=375761 RepID=A0A917TBQ8_9RHOB|nr:carbohydrate ABC transporter permease [Pseudooceanicola nanhaiensis]GGM17122.1 sn-glycerol-3-phosphate transport system permease protein UgpE [Pseudooceanicola nanhaiensis]